MAVVLTRFVPIIRRSCRLSLELAMRYSAFALFNVLGGALWVGVCLGAGYAFGNVPIVKNNFSLVAIGIVAVSMIPMLVEWIRNKRKG
jgi:membrane-associated protein